MIWNLERTKAALPNSYFWTWDHSTNWMLDDPGAINYGCYNAYLKRPETFVEDYARLTDLCAGLGVRGILIWGFLRDSHGGVEYAKRVAGYAAAKGVAIMPGIGTTWYGGCYYEGDHPYNLETFVKEHPDARMVDENGKPLGGGVCPTNQHYLDWLREGVRWLFREFEIGGANLENGDFVVCHDAGCKAHKQNWPGSDPDFFRFQAMSYVPALEAIESELEDKLVTWATYTGFVPGRGPVENCQHYMGCDRPLIVDRVPGESVCQWTLSGMLRRKPLPLTAYLDEGAPAVAFDNENWPEGLVPPSRRSVGFFHQMSQWRPPGRYDQGLSIIKEACLRAYRSGLEGVVMHGEVTSGHVPCALNYLAFSHFIHWPEDTIRDYGRNTLGQVLGNEDEGEEFAVLLANWDAATLTDEQKQDTHKWARSLRGEVARGSQLERWRFWNWLARMANDYREPHTVTTY